MNKTLPMTMLVLAAVALTVTPTASACQVVGGPGAETVNYLTCGSPVAGFALEEAGEVAEFVVEYVTGIPLP